MFGCHLGRMFQVTVSGGSYQEGLAAIVQGVPSNMELNEAEIYADLLLRKPGADELSSPRKEPDIPVLFTGMNVADTSTYIKNGNRTNGTPVTILIPNLDRHDIHVQQYQDKGATPRPGHASFASFGKYGHADDTIGAGIFSGRYTSTIVAAGYIAKKILKKFGIELSAYIKELAGVACPETQTKLIFDYSKRYKEMRIATDPFYQELYAKGRITPSMRSLEKMAVLAEVETRIDQIRESLPPLTPKQILDRWGVHSIVNCPDIAVCDAMLDACNKIVATGDSAGGIIELVVTGVPVGLGEPVFSKLDAELGRLLGIGAVKGVEVGAGFAVKDMPGSVCNDQIEYKNGTAHFMSNNAGGITGGLTTGQEIICRVAVKPTPTINKPQKTIDLYSKKNIEIAAITRRDPTIVGRIWPVIENYTAMVLLDHLICHLGYQELRKKFE